MVRQIFTPDASPERNLRYSLRKAASFTTLWLLVDQQPVHLGMVCHRCCTPRNFIPNIDTVHAQSHWVIKPLCQITCDMQVLFINCSVKPEAYEPFSINWRTLFSDVLLRPVEVLSTSVITSGSIPNVGQHAVPRLSPIAPSLRHNYSMPWPHDHSPQGQQTGSVPPSQPKRYNKI